MTSPTAEMREFNNQVSELEYSNTLPKLNGKTPRRDGVFESQQGVATQTSSNSPFRLLSIDDLMSASGKEWLLDDLIGKGDLVMVFGESGAGKTFLGIDLLVSAVLGTTWAGRFDVEGPLKVVYSFSEGWYGVKERVRAAKIASKIKFDDLASLYFLDTVPQLFGSGEDSAENLIEKLKSTFTDGLDILVIDTLHGATVGADENSARDMGVVLQSVRKLKASLGCAVILVHHANKSGTGERGSSALRGAMDVIMEVTGRDASRVLKCDKIKDGKKFSNLNFTLQEAGSSVYPKWGPITKSENSSKGNILSALSDKSGEWLTVKQISELTGSKDSAVSNLLKTLVEEGKVHRKLLNKSKTKSSRNPWTYALNTKWPSIIET